MFDERRETHLPNESEFERLTSLPTELSDKDLEQFAAGKLGGGVGGRYSGLGVRPGLGVGAPGFGWRRGIG